MGGGWIASLQKSLQGGPTARSRSSCAWLATMIHFFLLQNRTGITRISKWYSPFEHEEKKKLSHEIFRLLLSR